jgi:N utilization substance protein B
MSATIPQKQQSRELALQLLFQKEFSDSIASHLWPILFEMPLPSDVIEFTQELLEGVNNHSEKIDSKIRSITKNWKIERMSLVDRNVLRLGIFEMLMAPHPLPAPIVINEYVELAKKYGTTDSGSFVNGILDQAAKETSWRRGTN